MYPLFASVGPALGRLLATAAPQLMAKIAARIGTVATPSAIMAAIKANPFTAAMVAWELGEAGTTVYTQVAEAHPEVVKQIESTIFRADKVAPGTRQNLVQQREELDIIARAARAAGGFENLIAFRQAMLLEDEHFALYRELSTMPRYRG